MAERSGFSNVLLAFSLFPNVQNLFLKLLCMKTVSVIIQHIGKSSITDMLPVKFFKRKFKSTDSHSEYDYAKLELKIFY